MKPRKKLPTLLALVVVAVLGYGTWVALKAHRNLVTLNVRNMEVREVVKKIERQTWESIFVQKEVQGKVTFNVRNAPLEDVLKIIGDQTFSRWSAIYPLYSNGKSLAWFEKALRGEADPVEHGWTNLQSRLFFGRGPMLGGGPGGGPFGEPARNADQRVSMQIQDKDLSFATLALARYAQVRVVSEDGTAAKVNLKLNRASVSEAVSQLAKKAGRSWTKLYTLRGEFGPGGPGGPRGPGGPPQVASRDPNGEDWRGPRGPELTPEQREEFRTQRESLEEELKQVLPADEREKLELAQQQREQQFQEMQNLTPEQRRERFGQMSRTGMDKMNRDRVRNSTPEQRAEMNQRMSRMRRSQPPPSR